MSAVPGTGQVFIALTEQVCALAWTCTSWITAHLLLCTAPIFGHWGRSSALHMPGSASVLFGCVRCSVQQQQYVSDLRQPRRWSLRRHHVLRSGRRHPTKTTVWLVSLVT